MLDKTLVVIDVILILGLILLSLTPKEALFSIDAVTDRFSMESKTGETPIDWGQQAVALPPSDQSSWTACDQWLFNFSDLRAAARIVVTGSRQGVGADVSSINHASLGQLTCETGVVREAPARLVVSWTQEEARSLLLSSSGRLLLGAVPPGNGTSAKVVRQGSISLESRAFGGFAGSAKRSFDMALGDELRIMKGQQPSVSYVLAEYSDTGRLHIVARAKGGHAEITRFGQDRADRSIIAPSLFDILRSQSSWETILVLTAILIHFLSCLARIADRLSQRRATSTL